MPKMKKRHPVFMSNFGSSKYIFMIFSSEIIIKTMQSLIFKKMSATAIFLKKMFKICVFL